MDFTPLHWMDPMVRPNGTSGLRVSLIIPHTFIVRDIHRSLRRRSPLLPPKFPLNRFISSVQKN